jgi:hypothetical protein
VIEGELADGVRAVRETLEALVLGADESASPALPPAADEALRAGALELGRVLHVDPADPQVLGWIDAALAAVERAHRSIGAASAPVEAELAEVTTFLGELRRSYLDIVARCRGPAPVTATAPEFSASRGRPALFAGVAVPELPRPLAREGDFMRHDDDDAPGPWPAAPPHPLRRVARDCLENLGDLGNLRMLYDHERWGEATAFEDRLLASLDALASFALPRAAGDAPLDVVAEAFRYATQWTVPDTGRTFALVFLLGCLDVEEARRALTWAVHRAAPRTHPGVVDALALASGPAVDELVAALLSEDREDLLRVGISVAARRGTSAVESLVALTSHPRGDVARSALIALASVSSALAEPAARDAAGRQDVALLAHAILFDLGARGSAEDLRRALAAAAPDDVDLPRAFASLAFAGESADGELLRRIATGRSELAPALSIHGDPASASVLVERLRAEETSTSDVATRVVDALQRLLGPLAPAPGTGVVTIAELRDPQRWTEHIAHGRLVGRSRGGIAFHPKAIVAELRDLATRQGDRRLLARELAHHRARRGSDGFELLDVEGWTRVQAAVLASDVLR